MFQNLKHNKIYKIGISIDKILKPYWDLMKVVKGISLIEELDFSSFDPVFESEKEGIIKKLRENLDKSKEDILHSYLSKEDQKKL